MGIDWYEPEPQRHYRNYQKISDSKISCISIDVDKNFVDMVE
jgi:hypothetical protein